jgi:hypothetical protein
MNGLERYEKKLKSGFHIIESEGNYYAIPEGLYVEPLGRVFGGLVEKI